MPLQVPSITKYVWQEQSIIAEIYSPPVELDYVTVAKLSGGVQILFIRVGQCNNEAAGKSIQLQVITEEMSFDGTDTLDSSSTEGYYACGGGAGDNLAFVKETDETKAILPLARSSINIQSPPPVRLTSKAIAPLEAKEVTIKLRFNDTLGTNQSLAIRIAHRKLVAL